MIFQKLAAIGLLLFLNVFIVNLYLSPGTRYVHELNWDGMLTDPAIQQSILTWDLLYGEAAILVAAVTWSFIRLEWVSRPLKAFAMLALDGFMVSVGRWFYMYLGDRISSARELSLLITVGMVLLWFGPKFVRFLNRVKERQERLFRTCFYALAVIILLSAIQAVVYTFLAFSNDPALTNGIRAAIRFMFAPVLFLSAIRIYEVTKGRIIWI
jgi:hypothetical protein